MHIIRLLAILVFSAIAMTGCRQVPVPDPQQTQMPAETPPQHTYWQITAQEAKALLDKDHAHTITLVDVRTEEEYREKRIPNSLLLPVTEVEKLAPTMLPNKDATILLYCRSGRRSREAATTLVAMGYSHVYDFGGIINWPYETVSDK
jgi:rhodanese-related sulfurtransferase